jgi:hypothetical protein
MQYHIFQTHADHRRNTDVVQRATAVPKGAKAAHPTYGIDFLDHSGSPNNTGLPDVLKDGVENLSGLAMDDVRVHYNSPKPVQLRALAYTQGTDIHVAPGQERHLPHEAWHVVQQKQGRVRPTIQMKSSVPINDDKRLEQEADAMGEKAARLPVGVPGTKTYATVMPIHNAAIQAQKNTAPASMEERPAGMKNDTWEGAQSGPIALPGYKFISDPFDHTVVVVRPDGTGTQYTYTAEDTSDANPRMRLVHTEDLSQLRVKALGFLDETQGTFQETEKEKDARKDKDKSDTAKKQKDWLDSPANQSAFNTYNEALKQYDQDMKSYREMITKEKGKNPSPPKPPAPPKGMPANQRTTLCNAFPPKMGNAIGGKSGALGNFDPSVEGQKRGSWRTLKTNLEGPKPGDVYSLGVPNDAITIKHIGIFKSKRPGPDGMEIWTVVDGGQGTYEALQMVKERTRYYNPKTHILSTKLADAGQRNDDRSLRGWIDIDVHFIQP